MNRILIVLLLSLPLLGLAQKNVVKVGIGGISMGDYTLGYERAITPKSSINVNVGYWNLNYGALPVNMLLDISTDVSLSEIKSGIHTALDYRFYVGQHDAPKGFYIGPYLRYWDYKLVMTDEIRGTHFNLNTKAAALGGGFLMGYHWLVSNKFSIDWYFLGIGAERLWLNADYVTRSGAAFNYNNIVKDVRDVFKGFTYAEKRLLTEPETDRLKVVLPLWAPGIRTGITVGYAF